MNTSRKRRRRDADIRSAAAARRRRRRTALGNDRVVFNCHTISIFCIQQCILSTSLFWDVYLIFTNRQLWPHNFWHTCWGSRSVGAPVQPNMFEHPSTRPWAHPQIFPSPLLLGRYMNCSILKVTESIVPFKTIYVPVTPVNQAVGLLLPRRSNTASNCVQGAAKE